MLHFDVREARDIRMHRINLSLRAGPCRNIPGTRSWGHPQSADEPCEPKLASEKCEITFAPGISETQGTHVLDRDDLFCAMCGISPGDIDELTGREAKFDVEIIWPENIGGGYETPNLKMLCSTCNQGAKNITTEKPSKIWLLSQVRRAGQDEQVAVLKWLREKFKA